MSQCSIEIFALILVQVNVCCSFLQHLKSFACRCEFEDQIPDTAGFAHNLSNPALALCTWEVCSTKLATVTVTWQVRKAQAYLVYIGTLAVSENLICLSIKINFLNYGTYPEIESPFILTRYD